MAKTSMKAVLHSLNGEKKRDAYVSAPPPKVLRRQKDFFLGAVERDLPYGSKDVLYFQFDRIEIIEQPHWLEPEQIAHYNEIEAAQYAQFIKAEAALAQQVQIQKAILEKQMGQQLADKLMYIPPPSWWQAGNAFVNSTAAPTPPAAKPVKSAPPKPVEPAPRPAAIPEPFVPKRRMMKI